MPRRKEPKIPDVLLDQLLAGADPKTAFDPNGLLEELKKALAERALNAEMDHHLAGEGGVSNSRNGYGRKSVITDTGKIELEVPRARQASFDPQLIAKYQRRFPGFDDKLSIAVRSTHVRAGDEHPRDPGPPARALRHRGLARPGQSRHRRGAGRGGRVAEPAARGASGAVPRSRWSSSTRCGSRSGTRARSATRRSTSPSACAPTAPRRCSASGSNRPRAPSSGCAS